MTRTPKYYNADGTLRGFLKAHKSLPCTQQDEIEDEIKEHYGWADSTFRAKRNGSRKVQPDELEYLKAIFEKYGVDYQTGENIFYR
jgi:hypothetical protein